MHETQPAPGGHGLQPLLHDATVALRAPAQVWSRADGSIGDAAIDGVYVSDVRILDRLRLRVAGAPGEHIATDAGEPDRIRFVSLHRALDARDGADPDVRGALERRVRSDGVDHVFTLESRLRQAVVTDLVVEIRAAAVAMDVVKAGLAAGLPAPEVRRTAASVAWGDGVVDATLSAPGATIEVLGDGAARLRWTLEVPPGGSASARFDLTAVDAAAVVRSAGTSAPWRRPVLEGADDRLVRWVDRALGDLDALRLVARHAPDDEFLAAGAPWFFTLFGRDAIWAARMLLPIGLASAAGTLRTLAALQGTRHVSETAEQPGKILHELRRAELDLPELGIRLPPRYYGTVDATPLWICLLAEARGAGLPDAEVRPLLPALRAALAWMRDWGDADGDGLLEYVDESGRGLSNQGWKDSGDSIQWRDGRLATGPIALCEVQAYAYQAAVAGAALLEELDDAREEADEWRAWAARLADRFRASFWIDRPDGAYPAIGLDAGKRPIDTVTSNMGHLLGTGLLAPEERRLVASRLVSPELASGFGLRTMSTDSAGYWPLAYHGGSVWAHDTAIAVAGLVADGFHEEAAQLAEGLLRAAAAFDYRMPELYSGDADVVVPYPAACRPQAWSAAAAITVLEALRR